MGIGSSHNLFIILIASLAISCSKSAALKITNTGTQDSVLLERLQNKALSFWFTSLDSVQNIAEKQLIVAENNHSLYGQVQAYSNLWYVANARQDYQAAIEAGLKALALAEQDSVRISVSPPCNNLGMTYQGMKKSKLARSYFNRSKAIGLRSDDKIALAISLSNIAVTFESEENFLEAFEYARKAYEIFKMQNGFENALTRTVLNMGLYQLKLDHLPESINWLKKATQSAAAINDQEALALAYQYTAKLKLAQHRYDSAIQLIGKSMSISQLGSLKSITLDNLFLYSECYKRTFQFEKALQYFENGKALADSIFNTQNEILVKKLDNQYEVDKQRNLAEQYKLNALILQQSNDRQRRQFTVGIIVAVCLALSGIVVANIRSKLRSTQLALEKTKIELDYLKAQTNPPLFVKCFK